MNGIIAWIISIRPDEFPSAPFFFTQISRVAEGSSPGRPDTQQQCCLSNKSRTPT